MTAANAPVGTQATSDATCPVNTTLVGGGGKAISGSPQSVAMVQSFPKSATVWETVGIVTTQLDSGNTLTATAYAICAG
ncbi:MAG: hypothetical protein ACYDAY_00005 [Candidatus Dormibacteria bacterium]